MRQRKSEPFVAVLTARAGAGRQEAARLAGLRQALSPEAGRALPGARVTLRAFERGRAFEIRIEADSLRTLRAAVNSYLRWSALALDVADRAVDASAEE